MQSYTSKIIANRCFLQQCSKQSESTTLLLLLSASIIIIVDLIGGAPMRFYWLNRLIFMRSFATLHPILITNINGKYFVCLSACFIDWLLNSVPVLHIMQLQHLTRSITNNNNKYLFSFLFVIFSLSLSYFFLRFACALATCRCACLLVESVGCVYQLCI